MAKKRLLNCEFINASSFKVNLSNKAKLLYVYMFVNADDKGFVDTTNEIIESLTKNDTDFRNEINLELLENDYNSALVELIGRGLIFEFRDNHGNRIHLIRHWYYHNKMVKGLWTNYGGLLEKVHVSNNEYILGKKPLKENNINETNIDNDIDIDMVSKEQPKKELTIKEMFGKDKYEELTEKEKEKYLEQVVITDDDLPM